MKLLEVVRADKTSKETLATAMKLSKTIKKVGVVAGVCDGFIGNRMLHGYFREAGFLLEEGALPQQVDKVIEDFGFAMGPFRVGDLAGLDVGWYIRKRQAATRPAHLRYSKVADQICELGRFGQKTGAGWYRYEAGNRTPTPDPIVEELIVKASKEAGIERRADQRSGNPRALHVRADQRGREDPGRRHRAARERHRHRLHLRLRLPALSRRTDVLRRHWSGSTRCTSR